MIDPVVAWVVRIALSALFAVAASHKLRDFPVFLATLSDYRLLPRPLVPLGAAALVGVEVAVALALVGWPEVGAVGAAILLSVYSLAIGWNLLRGRRHIDCGCLGPAGRRSLSGWLVVRNVALSSGAVALLLGSTARALVWVDAVSVVGGVLACALLWAAANALATVGAPRAFGEVA